MCKVSFIKEDVVYLINYLFNNIVNTFLLKVILESGIPLIRQKTNINNNKIQNKQTKQNKRPPKQQKNTPKPNISKPSPTPQQQQRKTRKQ